MRISFRAIVVYRLLVCILCSCFIYGCGQEQESQPQVSTVVSAAVAHEGKAIYDKFCKVCHAQGLNGAPILGNQKMWGSRAEKGSAGLLESAKNGFGLMPANLGRDLQLDDAAIEKAVDYMLSEL